MCEDVSRIQLAHSRVQFLVLRTTQFELGIIVTIHIKVNLKFSCACHGGMLAT